MQIKIPSAPPHESLALPPPLLLSRVLRFTIPVQLLPSVCHVTLSDDVVAGNTLEQWKCQVWRFFLMEKFEQQCGKMVLVLHGSSMSTCEGFVAVGRGSELGLSCQGTRLGLVLVVTSTHNGLPQDNTKVFLDWLPTNGASIALKNVAFIVFGAGSCQVARDVPEVRTVHRRETESPWRTGRS